MSPEELYERLWDAYDEAPPLKMLYESNAQDLLWFLVDWLDYQDDDLFGE
jgi:uncharacterized protein YqiB (DUF1249 family)